MAHHPYSFSNPAEPTVTRSHRPFQVTDERARAWDNEAPATAHDSEFERKESRAPLYIAGAASVVILGGLLLLATAAVDDPPLAATVATETMPRQAAMSEMLDAQALDRARIAIRDLAPATTAPGASTAVESSAADSTSMTPISGVESSSAPGPTSVDASVGSTGVEADPAPAQLPAEPLMTPAPTTDAPVVLDRDNPYTSEIEAPAAPSDTPAAQRGTQASDNPY